MTRRGAVTAVVNLVTLGAFGWAVEHFWGWSRLLAPWSRIAPGLLALALTGMIASYALRALRIYVAESAIPRHRYPDCLRLILINNVVNLLLPSRTGEASFPILMNRWFGVDPVRATGTLIWLRLLDLHVLATVGGICAASGWISAGLDVSRLAGAGALAAALGPPLLFAARRPLTRRLSGRGGRASRLALRVLDGVPSQPATLATDLALTWSAWLIKLATLAAVLSKLAGIPFILAVLGAIGGDLSTVLPVHAPGGFGTYELGALALLAPGTNPGATGPLLAAVVDLHLMVLTTALLAGALAWVTGTKKTPQNS